MSVFTRKTTATAPVATPAPLADQLATKGSVLRARQQEQAARVTALLDAAEEARAKSEEAARRASVVEQAVSILGDAADVD